MDLKKKFKVVKNKFFETFFEVLKQREIGTANIFHFFDISKQIFLAPYQAYSILIFSFLELYSFCLFDK